MGLEHTRVDGNLLSWYKKCLGTLGVRKENLLFSRPGMITVMLLVLWISVVNMKVTRSSSIGNMQEFVSLLVPGGVATKRHGFWQRKT